MTKHVTADISYSDYLVLFVEADPEWSRMERAPFDSRNHSAVRESCQTFAMGINKHFKRWACANCAHYDHGAETCGQVTGQRPGDEGCDQVNARDDFVARYLYNPVRYYGLMRPADMNLILLDDFDPPHHITMRVSHKLRESAIAFCPTLDSLRLEDFQYDGAKGAYLDEFHNLPDEALSEVIGNQARSASQAPRYDAHSFQREMPFCVVTRFKLEMLASLGCVISTEWAVFRAMAKAICDSLHPHVVKDKEGMPTSRVDFAGRPAAVKCLLLDFQRSEEVALVTMCNDISVAASLVSILRSLTFTDLFDVAPDLSRLYKEQILHSHVFERPNTDSGWSDLQALHVFRWTDSSVYVANESLENADAFDLHGEMYATSDFRVAPGHFHALRERIGNCEEKKSFLWGYCDLESRHRGMGGKDTHDEVRTDANGRLVTARELINEMRDNLRLEPRPKPNQSPKAWHPRDTTDFQLRLSVDLIQEVVQARQQRLSQREPAAHDSAPVHDLLRRVESVLCRPGAEPEKPSEQYRHTDLRPLHCHAGIHTGLPVSLRRAVERLYQVYYILLCDPDTCDMVIDLYDVFAAFQELCLHVLPEIAQNNGTKGAFLTGECIDQIVEFVDALENGLEHRLSREPCEPGILGGDISLDFRGGMNQIVLAANAMAISSAGLLRHGVLEGVEGVSSRRNVGFATRVSLAPGAYTAPLETGQGGPPYLACVNVDVPRVLHATSYADYLHEAAHLILRAYRERSPNGLKLPGDEVLCEHLSEAFALLVTQLFLFGADTDSPLLHDIGTFARSVESIGDERETICRLSSFFLRRFLALDGLRNANSEEDFHSVLNQGWQHEEEPPTERYAAMVDRAGRHFPEFESLISPGDALCPGWRYLQDQFIHNYRLSRSYMPQIWRVASELYLKAQNEYNFPGSGNWTSGVTDESIRAEIAAALPAGRPLMRENIFLGETGGSTPTEKRQHMDTLYISCRILHEYIRAILGAEDSKGGSRKEVRLHRDPKSREVIFPELPKGELWHKFLIDRTRASMFCPVPEARRKRLQKQIAVTKSFFGISASLRARRLAKLFEDFGSHQ